VKAFPISKPTFVSTGKLNLSCLEGWAEIRKTCYDHLKVIVEVEVH